MFGPFYAVSIGNINANSGDGFSTDTNSTTLEDLANQTFIFSVSGLDADGKAIPGVSYSGIWNAGGTEFLDITAPPAAVENGKVTVTDTAVDVTWDSNGADFYRVYANNSELGFIESPLLTGDVTSYQFDRSQFPAGSTWTVSGVGRAAWTMAAAAIAMGGNVRVGFEDNIYLGKGQKAASNGELVAKVVRIAKELGREIATPAEAREILSLKPLQ